MSNNIIAAVEGRFTIIHIYRSTRAGQRITVGPNIAAIDLQITTMNFEGIGICAIIAGWITVWRISDGRNITSINNDCCAADIDGRVGCIITFALDIATVNSEGAFFDIYCAPNTINVAVMYLKVICTVINHCVISRL